MKMLFLLLTIFVLIFTISFAIFNMDYNAKVNVDENNITGSLQDIKPNEEKSISNKNVLILGIDTRKGEPSRSDVIILVNTKKDKVNLLSIPRDTRVEIKNKGKTKINSTYAYGGINLNKATIENLLDLKIDNYIVLNFNAIKKGVDAIGGFTITIAKDVKISDPELKKKFTLTKGSHKLNGIQVLEYLRYRNDGKGDLARIYRQQQFIQDLQQNFLKLENIPLIPRAYAAIHDEIQSDMGASDMATYFIQCYHLRDKFEYYTLEGQAKTINGISYFILNKNSLENIKEILNK